LFLYLCDSDRTDRFVCAHISYGNRGVAGAENLINQRFSGFWERYGRVLFDLMISLWKLILPRGKIREGILCGFVLVYYDNIGFDKGVVRETEY